jgi:predicted metalloprotease with PDZ domain
MKSGQLLALLAGTALLPMAAAAQGLPVAAHLPDAIPAAADTPWPGTITLDVDATNVAQGLFTVRETIPVTSGPLVLLYPEWKPGNHAPAGQIKNVAGLTITANGKPLLWSRDTVDMYAFHVDVPKGVKTIEARFQYLSPVEAGGDYRVVAAPTLLNLQWESVSLYPAGHYVRDIQVKASATYPAGWTAFSALRGVKTGNRIAYDQARYDILVDSPVYAGLNAKQIALDPAVSLDIVADTPEELAITPAQIATQKALVVQADRLFGARHFDHYDFLLAASDVQSGDGLEHHRSSENSADGVFFTEWGANVANRYVTAHEFTHSWNGKFRRPADLWTPDYRTPMQDSGLWVYEGQTQFWGDVLAARAGVWSKQEYLDTLANVAAGYTAGTPGMDWRPLQDTTNDPILTGHGDTSAWGSWSRGYDYYRNSELIWLEADQTIRELSHGAKGLDDFAALFFGVEPDQWDHEVTYRFDDVVAALNQVQPYDWASFLRQRLDGTSPTTTLAGIEKAGYKLVFTDEPSATTKEAGPKLKGTNLTYSLGLNVNAKGMITSVLWNGPAFKAGLKPNDMIVGINGLVWDAPRLRAAVTAAKTGTAPIALLIQDHDRFSTVPVDYHGGLRYPHLERTSTGEAGLDRLIAAK